MRWLDPDNGEWVVMKQGEVPGTAIVDQFQTAAGALCHILKTVQSGMFTEDQVSLAHLRDLVPLFQATVRVTGTPVDG